MALSETARLLASLELKDKFSPTLAKANKGLGQFDAKLDKSSTRAYKAGQQIGTGVKNIGKLAVAGAGIIAANVAVGLNSLIELEKQQAQTAAVLKSTGGAAGVSAQQVTKLAESYEALNATIGDEVIRSSENLLLTFTNVKSKAFEPALKAILDMNTAMGGDENSLKNVTIQVGKALNDPTKGLTALRRVGVAFTKDQEKKIKSLQKEGKLYEAQQLILGELNKEFGGSFAAQGNTTAGAVAKFADAIDDAQRSLAQASLPAVRNIADALTELVNDPEIQQGIKDLGADIGKLLSKDNIKNAAGTLRDVFGTIKASLPAIEAGVSTIATVVGKAVDAFNALPGPIKGLLVGGVAINKLTGGLLTNVAGGVASKLFDRGNSPAAPLFVKEVSGGLGGAAGAAGAGAGKFGGLMKAFAVAGIVTSVASVVAEYFQQNANSTAQANDIHDAQKVYLAQNPTTDELKNSLRAVDKGISDLQSNPLLVLVQGDALTQLQQMRAELQSALAKFPSKGTEDSPGKRKDDVVKPTKAGFEKSVKNASKNAAAAKAAVAKVQHSVDKDRAATVARLNAVKKSTSAVRDKVESAKIAQVAATNLKGSQTVSAIDVMRNVLVATLWATRPTISVTNVTNASATSKNTKNNAKTDSRHRRKGGGGLD